MIMRVLVLPPGAKMKMSPIILLKWASIAPHPKADACL